MLISKSSTRSFYSTMAGLFSMPTRFGIIPRPAILPALVLYFPGCRADVIVFHLCTSLLNVRTLKKLQSHRFVVIDYIHMRLKIEENIMTKFIQNALWVFVLVTSVSCHESKVSDNRDKHFVIVTTSYKNARWYKKNLDSVFSQTYKNWRMIYTDDCSPDSTGELVEEYLKMHDIDRRVTLIRNKDRKLALHNIVDSIYQCKDSDIIVSLDGDDSLAHENVLSLLNEVYKNSDIWMTFGNFSYESTSKKNTWLHDYSQQIKDERTFRYCRTTLPSHLRTFYAGLFKKIKIEDLKHGGRYFDMAWDFAFMIPMIEMAYRHYFYFDEVLYSYNDLNDINDFRIDAMKQIALADTIRKKSKYLILEQRPY